MKQELKQGKKNKIGAMGEKIAKNSLKKKGFIYIEANYLKKWGEIDLIFKEYKEKREKIRFVEVKTVSYETKQALEKAVSYGTWRPEENVTKQKLLKMNRTIESWLLENNKTDLEWQIDVIAVRVVPHEKFATVKHLDNIII